jgi:hypothetical protein
MGTYGVNGGTANEKLCGVDCEVQCPLMRLGRVCPSIAEHRAEMRELMTAA